MTKRKDSNNRVLKEGESQRPNGTYEYKYRNSEGERKSLYAKTLEDLRKKEESVTKDRLEERNNWGDTHTVNDLFDKWFSLKRGIRDSTRCNYMSLYNNHIKDDIGKKKVSAVRKSAIKEFYLRLIDGKRLNESSVTLIHVLMIQAFDIAVDDNVIKVNPARGATRGLFSENTCTKKHSLSVEQYDELERFVAGTKYEKRWPVVQFLAWTGMRIGEVSGLTWEDVDLENNVIHVRRTLQRIGLPNGAGYKTVVHEPKTEAGTRDIPLLAKARQALFDERRRQFSRGLRSTEEIDGVSDFVFVRDNGGTLYSATIDSYLNTVVNAYNSKLPEGKDPLPRMSNHTFRHTFATRMLVSGVSLKAMQSILGHAQIATTLDIYTDPDVAYLTDQLKALEAM